MTRMLVFDTETGGIDPVANSILSLGAVIWEDGVPGAEFEVRIREPVLSLTIEAMAVNKINLVEHAKTAVTPAEAMKKFRAFLRKHFKSELAESKVLLAGHNVSFDIGFLKRLCRLAGQSYEELFSHRSTDTAGILRFMALAGRSNLNGAGLDEALAYFEVTLNRDLRHTALEDARATAMLLTELIELARPASGPVVPTKAKRGTKVNRSKGGRRRARNGPNAIASSS